MYSTCTRENCAPTEKTRLLFVEMLSVSRQCCAARPRCAQPHFNILFEVAFHVAAQASHGLFNTGGIQASASKWCTRKAFVNNLATIKLMPSSLKFILPRGLPQARPSHVHCLPHYAGTARPHRPSYALHATDQEIWITTVTHNG